MRISPACGVGLLCALCLIGGCVQAPDTGADKTVIEEVAMGEAGIARHWDLQLNLAKGESVKSLKLDGPVLLATTTQRRLFVVDAESRQFLCYINLGREGEPIYGISRHLNRIYVVGVDGFREYDLASGRLLRKLRLPFAPSTKAVRNNDEIYIGSLDGKLYAMLNEHGKNLARVWSYPSESGITSGPVVMHRLVMIASVKGEVLALRSVRKVAWRYRCNGRISCDLVAERGKVFIASEDTKVYCLSATGRLLWQQFLEAPLYQSPVPIGRTGMLYQYSPGRGMYALQVERQGKPAWKSPRADLTKFVAATRSRAYFVNTASELEAVNSATGEKIVAFSMKRSAMFATNREDSSIFLCTTDGRVVALRDKNGTYINRGKLFTALAR